VKRVSGTLPTLVQSYDTDGNPVLTFSADATPVAGEKVVVIRIKPIARALALTSVGTAADVYAPHLIQICTEANYASTVDSVADILTPVEILPILGDVISVGAITEWYVSANGTLPAIAEMTTANLKATYEAIYQSFVGAQ
jgi:hypothetical protein